VTEQSTFVRPGEASPAPFTRVTAPRPMPVRRRRPALLALAIALVVLTAAANAWLFATSDSKVEVLAVARPVPFGQVIADEDLTVARITADPAVETISASDRGSVVGKRAAVALLPRTMLTRAAVTDETVPAVGQQLVPIAVKPSQLPATPLSAQDRILIVSTPQADADPPTADPQSTPATVYAVGRPDVNGVVVVDVLVDTAAGPLLAARAATGRVMIVLQPRTGG
jgi:hypothetical protein